MRRIPGTPLLGFAEVFDEAYGRPGPTPLVTPSHRDGKLLPFACPHCAAPTGAAVVMLGYLDPERGHRWCPRCQGRFMLDTNGTPLVGALAPGAKTAPALVDCVERGQLLHDADGLFLLGVR